MISLMLTMDMKAQAQTLTSLWLLMVLIGLLSQDLVHAGLLQHQKQGTGKEIHLVTAKPKAINKSKTTATSTTAKPNVDSLTTNSSEYALDGRHVYISNQFVAQQEPLQDNTPALYEILQQQMENVLSNTGLKRQIYNDNSQGKKMTEENANIPAKPLFPYNINNFNDYNEDGENEEELSEQEEQQTENCEDTEESLSENDDSTMNGNAAPISPQSEYSQTQQQNTKSSAQNSYNQNKPTKGPYDSAIQSNKPSTAHRHKKPAPQPPQITYPKTSPNQKTDKPSKSYETGKPAHSNKPSQNTTNGPQSSSNNHQKRQSINKSSKYKSSILQNDPSNRTFQSDNKPQEPQNKPTKPIQTIHNVNSNTNSVSPFSTPAISGSKRGKTRPKRRHLIFRTVSSSTQFFATPLADLMLKISIGLAKPLKAGVESNHSQIYDKNDIEIRS